MLGTAATTWHKLQRASGKVVMFTMMMMIVMMSKRTILLRSALRCPFLRLVTM